MKVKVRRTGKKTVETPVDDDGRRSDGTFKGRHPWAFKPGESGNPAGRPKAAHLSTAYKRKLAETVPGDPQKRTFAEVIAEGMAYAAMNGKAIAAKEIRQATEGDLIRASVDWRTMLGDMGLDPDKVLEEMMAYVQEQTENT